MKIAAVQAAPVFLDRAATLDRVVELIRAAAEEEVDLIGFPEGFLPGHPGWIELHGMNDLALGLSKELFRNAVEVPGESVDLIGETCRETRTAAVVGVCERRAGSTGTLFNTQLFIDEHGALRTKHQKYVPTVGERLVHAPGTTGSVNSFAAHGISVSGLMCGENSNPLAQYAAACAYPTVHVASWPQHFSPAVSMQPVIELASRGLAYSLKCFVINAVTIVTDRMIEAYGQADETFLRSEKARGRASIIAPTGEILAEAADDSEQLVVAEVDPEAVIVPKFIQDTAGHYNRPELFAPLLGVEPGHGGRRADS